MATSIGWLDLVLAADKDHYGDDIAYEFTGRNFWLKDRNGKRLYSNYDALEWESGTEIDWETGGDPIDWGNDNG